MDRTPASIGGFTIESVLGTGGTSTVYLAHDADRVVALKLFRTRCPAPPTLSHPRIVQVHSSGETDGRTWLAMQYVVGGDADRELRAGRMAVSRAGQIITDIAEALDFAHANGVVHGDVKPSNFLLAEGDRALLSDFGSRPFATDAVVLTSAAFAAPEMLRGKAIDRRADIYSLGCSLFRLLTGKPPFFDAGSKDAVVQAHLHREPPRVSRFAPWLPAAMDDVVAVAMAKDPGRRFRCARALADAALTAIG